MKKSIICFSIILALLFCFFPKGDNSIRAFADGDYTLLFPSALVVVEDNIFVADDATGKVLKYANPTGTSGCQPLQVLSLSNVKKLVATPEGIIALTKTEDSTALYLLDTNLASATPISFISSYAANNIVDFAVSGSTIYALRSSGDIDYFSLSGTSLSAPSTISKTHLPLLQDEIEFFLIDVVEDLLSIKTGRSSFALNQTTYQVTKEMELEEGENFLFSCGDHAITSFGRVVQTSSATTIATLNGSCTGFSTSNGNIYLSSAATHDIRVLSLSDSTFSALKFNPDISLSRLETNNLKHIKLANETPLFYQPYSISPTLTLPASTNLNVVATYNSFYYCLVVVDGVNQFLYLNTSTAEIQEFEQHPVDTNFVTTRTSDIYTLPTTSVDSENVVLGTVSAGDEVHVVNSTTITNSSGELFYLVSYNGGFGYIRAIAIQSTKSAVQLTTKCNAKIKRATTLFKNADGTEAIMPLEKGTRIALLEETSPTKDYVKIEYQNAKGEVYTGYVLSDDLSPDGLSTLQILGLVLVGSNLALLITILLIKRNSKKWRV